MSAKAWYSHLPPLVDAHVTALLRAYVPGTPKRLFKVSKFRRGCPASDYFDRFCVSFAYCGTWVRVEVIYNAAANFACPDFVFEEGEEIDIMELSLLESWDSKNPESLLLVMKEIMNVYKAHQQKKVSECTNERVQFEFATLAASDGLMDLKVSGAGPEMVFHCYSPIELAVNEDSTASCYVAISMPCADPANTQCRVDTPAEYKHIFGQFALVQWNADSSTISEYLSVTEAHLENLVRQYHRSMAARKEFLEALLDRFSTALEFDSVDYTRVSFLFNYDKVKPIQLDIILHVMLPPDFPAAAPKVSLQSMLFTRAGKPIVKSVVDYPYSPRWPAEEMATRLGAFLAAVLPDFKANLVQTAQQALKAALSEGPAAQQTAVSTGSP